jgi:hypothetical protein
MGGKIEESASSPEPGPSDRQAIRTAGGTGTPIRLNRRTSPGSSPSRDLRRSCLIIPYTRAGKLRLLPFLQDLRADLP